MLGTKRKRSIIDKNNSDNNTEKSACTAQASLIQIASKRKKLTTEPSLDPALETLISQDSVFKKELRQGYLALQEANIPYRGNEQVYEALNKKFLSEGKLREILKNVFSACKTLRKANVPYSKYPKLCIKLLKIRIN